MSSGSIDGILKALKKQPSGPELKIHAISDTHRMHLDIANQLTGGDLLIHAGDADCFDEKTYESFLRWLIEVSRWYSNVIFVPGNHDRHILENLEDVRLDLEGTNIKMLINEYATILGLKVFGSPISEAYGDAWTAFAATESEIEAKLCPLIPDDLDILITHGPAFGICDAGYGSRSLAKRIEEVRPKLHLSGHIHHGESFLNEKGVVHANCAILGAPNFDIFGVTEIDYSAVSRAAKSAKDREGRRYGFSV